MSRANGVTAIAYPRHWSRRDRAALDARYAALLDALTANEGKGAYHLNLIRGAVNRGLIVSETDRRLTAFGSAWRADYTGTPVPVGRITVKTRGATDNGRKTAKERAPREWFMVVTETMVKALAPDELTLWMKAKAHQRDGLTLAQLAALLGEPVDHVRIRAERIRERGYAVACRDEEAA